MKRLLPLPIHLLLASANLILVVAAASCASGEQSPGPAGSSTPASFRAASTAAASPTSSASAAPALISKGMAVPFQTQAQGFRLGAPLPKPAVLLAANVASRDAMASLIDPGHQTLLKTVDLENKVILAAFWGARPFGGFSITISDISIANADVTVSVVLRENDPAVPRVDAVTSPYHLVTINRLALPREGTLHYRLVSGDRLLASGELP